MTKSFVVVVDLGDRFHARILAGGVFLAGALFIPVENAPDEGGDELHFRLGTGHGLNEREQERQVAIDFFLLQQFGGLDSFPRRGELDEDAFARDAGLFVEGDDFAGFGNRTVAIKGEPRVHLGRNAAGDDLQDLAAKEDEKLIDDLARTCGGPGILHRFGEQVCVVRHSGGLENQAGVGRGVARGELLHAGEVAGIGDDDGELLELVELRGSAHDKGAFWEVRTGGWARK